MVLPGKWLESNSGGSHLFDKPFEQKLKDCTWTKNPLYVLEPTPDPDGLTCIKITLSRPDRAWKKKIAKHTVGCTLGV